MKKHHLAYIVIVCIGMMIPVLFSSCVLFEFLYSNATTVLANALNKAIARGYDTQNEAAFGESTRSASRDLPEPETVEEGLTITIEEPVTTYVHVRKRNDDNTDWNEDVSPLEPPSRDDQSAPGLWQIVMDIDNTLTVDLDNYSKYGWTFNGEVTATFDARFEFHLDIGGSESETTSTLKSAITEITINGSVTVSGKDSGTVVFDNMRFEVEEHDDQEEPFCSHLDGTVTMGNKDLTDDFADYVEEELELK